MKADPAVRLSVLLMAGLLVMAPLAACTSGAPTAAPTVVATSAEEAAGPLIIDVRTAAEYSAGHLDGAVHLDLQSGAFAEGIKELDVDGAYVLYCRTGSRSAAAATLMREAGFTQVQDAGSLEAAAASTGRSIVT